MGGQGGNQTWDLQRSTTAQQPLLQVACSSLDLMLHVYNNCQEPAFDGCVYTYGHAPHSHETLAVRCHGGVG